MSTPREAMPKKQQATKPPVTDTQMQETAHAVDVSKSPVSFRKRAPPEDLVDIKVEDDDELIEPFASVSNAAKRPRNGNINQTNLPGPGLPLTPLSNKSYLQTSVSPSIAAGGPLQPSPSPWTPSSAKQTPRTRKGTHAFDHDSILESSSELFESEDLPQNVLQSVEWNDLPDDDDGVFTNQDLMQQIQTRASMQSSGRLGTNRDLRPPPDALKDVDPKPGYQHSATKQSSGSNQVDGQLAQGAARIESPASEENDADYDASQHWRREQIMLNAVLKARDEFSLLPSSWKVHFSGGPSTDRMFYRRVKDLAFRPRIYAHAEKYETTGAHHLRNMMQMSSRIRDLRIAQGKVARDPMRQQAAKDADQARLSKAITKKIRKLLTDAIHWSKVDGGLDVFGDQLLPNVAIVVVSGSSSSQAEIDDHMEKLAQNWRDRFASLAPRPSSETAPPVPVLYAFIIMNHVVLIATKDAATPNAPIHIPVKINIAERLQQSWNALGLMVTICWARDKLMEAAAVLKPNAEEGRKEESDPDA